MGNAFRDKLASSFRTFSLEDARLVGELKVLFSGLRQLLARDPEAEGLDTARRIADAVDALLEEYLTRSPHGGSLALLALGGYGRGELSPRSDLDLLILYPEGAEARASEIAGPLLGFLWDLGFEVGHAARSPAMCLSAMEGGDLPSATSMLEGRRVAGSQVLFRKYGEEAVRPWLDAHRGEFIRLKIEEARKRHRFYGGSACICNPNVKESPGGLRDMHVAGWISLALSGRRDFDVYREAGLLDEEGTRRLVDAYGSLHRIRNAMHTAAGERQDVLDVGLRPRVAEALGIHDWEGLSGVEHLMRDYYRAARTLHRFLFRVIRFQEGCGVRPGRPGATGGSAPGRRRLGGGLLALGDEICPEGEVRWTPRDALAAVLVAAEEGLTPAPELVDAIEGTVRAIDDTVRNDPGTARLFLRTLRSTDAGRSLRALDQAGFLREYLPEFGSIAGLIRDEYVHRYTVDEHTLRALDSLDWLSTGDHPAREEYERIARPDLLRLSILLHDVGKVHGPNHVARSVGMVPDVARRLGLEDGEARYVRFLVEHHQMIPELADGRAPAEAAVALAEAMPSEEYLRCLYLLTLADVEAVGGAALTGWREAQFAELFRAALARLSPVTAAPYLDRMLAVVGPVRETEAREHLARIGSRYALEVDPVRAARHLDLVRAHQTAGVGISHDARRGFGEVWVAAGDAAGTFARIAGALTLSGLDITGAHAYTRSDGVVLDRFYVTMEDDAPPSAESFWLDVARDIARSLSDPESLPERLRGLRRRFRPSPEAPPPSLVLGATASNRISEHYSLVTVTALDRPALLHDLAFAISRNGFNIHNAVVATRGGVVTDTFYIAWPDGKRPSERDLEPLLEDFDALAGEPEATEP